MRFVQNTFRPAAKKSILFPVTRGSRLLKTSEFFFQTRISVARGAILSPDSKNAREHIVPTKCMKCVVKMTHFFVFFNEKIMLLK